MRDACEISLNGTNRLKHLYRFHLVDIGVGMETLFLMAGKTMATQ